jgi:hypothetical protein
LLGPVGEARQQSGAGFGALAKRDPQGFIEWPFTVQAPDWSATRKFVQILRFGDRRRTRFAVALHTQAVAAIFDFVNSVGRGRNLGSSCRYAKLKCSRHVPSIDGGSEIAIFVISVNDELPTLRLDRVAYSADASKGLGQFQGAARGCSRFWIEQFSNDYPQS